MCEHYTPTQPQSTAEIKLGGASFDTYEIIRTISKGGMGTVYIVRDREHGWCLAAKTLKSPDVAVLDEEQNTQFAAEIEHLIEMPPNIHVVQIDSVKIYNGELYIFMEFIDGMDLREKLNRSKEKNIECATAIDYALQLCEGLLFIHEKGRILHLDVKPENILIDPQGVVKITDFGISRASLLLRRQTIHSKIVGTPLYMSPEQLKGERVDIWSDIYSFGIVFYEMLTGRLPYPFDIHTHKCKSMLREKLMEFHRSDYDFHKELSYKKIISELSDEVGTIIGHCLAKLPAQRVVDFRYLQLWIERELGRASKTIPAQLQEVDFHRKGVNLQAIGKHSKSLEWFNHALSVNPLNPKIWLDAATSCEALGMKREAADFRNRAGQILGGKHS